MAIDPIEEKKKSDPYAAYKAMLASGGSFGSKGPAQVTQEVNSGNNTTVENSNDRLNNNNAVSNAEAGVGGAASLIKQTGNAQGSFGGNSQQDSSGNSQGQRDVNNISNLARARESRMRAPVQVSFGDISPDERRVNSLRNSISEQYTQRFGIEPGEDMRNAINNMSDIGELEKALRSMATQTRLPAETSEFQQFNSAFLSSNPDAFESLG